MLVIIIINIILTTIFHVRKYMVARVTIPNRIIFWDKSADVASYVGCAGGVHKSQISLITLCGTLAN